ncbi:Glycine/sarcosine N-methyltransferase [subsurface metagenome]|nr:MAG: hypothetical protein CEE41_04225 [Hadesarchaea archaeon B3_Hades]
MPKDELYEKYARYYDLFYERKGYPKEASFIVKILKRHRCRKIIDVGCGTGRHAIILAKKGYTILGVDISKEMLKIARENAERENVQVDFRTVDMRRLNFRAKFDAVLCLYETILYNTTHEEIFSTIKSFNRTLRKGGILILDFRSFLDAWGEEWKKEVKLKRKIGERTHAETYKLKYNFFDQTVDRSAKYTISERGRKKVLNIRRAPIRKLFPQEIRAYLEFLGFKVLNFYGGFDLKLKNRPPKDWTVVVTAKKVKNI